MITEKKVNALVRISAGIALTAIVCLILYSSIAKNGTHTLIGHILAAIATALIVVASIAAFVRLLGALSAQPISNKTTDNVSSSRVKNPMRTAGVGFGLVILGVALVVVYSYLATSFPWLMSVPINSIVAPIVTIVGIMFIVRAVSAAWQQ